MRIFCAVFLLLCTAAPASARDLPSMTPDPGVAGIDAKVTLLETNGSRTFVAGDFLSLGTKTSGAAIVSALSGGLRTRVDVGWMRSAIRDGAGGWYVGTEKDGVRRVRGDGSVDPSFASPVYDFGVPTLALSPDGGTLWIGGEFGIRALDATTGAERGWRQQSGWFKPGSFVVTPTALYAAGYGYDDTEHSHGLIVLDPVTGAVRTWGTVASSGTVLLANDTLYVSEQGARVLALDPVTLAERWRATAGSFMSDFALTPDRRLIVTDRAELGGPAVYAFDAVTGARLPLSVPLVSAGALELSADGETAYVGAARQPGWPQQGAIAFSTRDGALLGWAPGGFDNFSVDDLSLSADGGSLLIESTPTLATAHRDGAALLDETGAPTAFRDPYGTGAVKDVVLDRASTAYFTRGGAVNAVALDGAPRWRVPMSAGTLRLSPDEQLLYVSGGTSLVALRTADGSAVPANVSVTGGVLHQALFSPDGATLYIEGTFTAVNGVARNGLAALDARSGAVLAMQRDFVGAIGAIKLSPDGKILYVGGEFGERDTPSEAHLLGLRTSDGGVVFRPDFDDIARTFVPLADGQTLLVAHDQVSAWDVATGQRLAWKINDCGQCHVDAMVLDPDGRTLHVAGSKVVLGGVSQYYARLAVNRSAAPPANTSLPRVVGQGVPGTWVDCDPGTWNGHPAAYAVNWARDGVPLDGFDTRTLLLESADAGHSITCAVTADGAAAVSSAGLVVAAGEAAPRRTAVVGAAPPAATCPAGSCPTGDPAPPAVAQPRVATPSGPRAVVARPDRLAPRVTLTRRGSSFRLTLSERATLKVSFRGRTRTLRLGAGRHTLTARRLTGRAKPGHGTLRVVARDAAGNVRVLRLKV